MKRKPSERKRRGNPQRGLTLYELLFVMTVTAMIATAAFPTLSRLVRAHRAATAETMTYRALDRLAHQFREDVRQADSVTANDGLVLTLGDTQIEYFVDATELRRKTAREDRTQTDAFALPPDAEFEFLAPSNAASGLARLRVRLPRRARSELDPIYLPIDLEALVGGDRPLKFQELP